MIAAHIFAGAGFAAFILYGYRTGLAWRRLKWADRTVRAFLLALVGTIAVGFLDVASKQDTLLWRQWVIGAALAGLALALCWPRPHHRPMIYAADVLAIIDGVATGDDPAPERHPGCMVARDDIRALTDNAI